MGLLRRLAGLVVEFPEEPSKKPPEADVASTIEQIRRSIESSARTSFDTPEPAHQAAGGAPGAPAAAAPASGAGQGIALPAAFSVAQIYERAQLKPDADGFDINKVAEMLADPDIASLPVEIRARSVRMALKSMGKDLRVVLEEAARRDKAIDDYHVFLQHRVDLVSQKVSEENARLEQEIDEFVKAKRAEGAQNKACLEQARQMLTEFERVKHTEEQRLFGIVAPFVSPGENPVVLSEEGWPGGAAPPKKEGGKDEA
jgi:hypothetical protein